MKGLLSLRRFFSTPRLNAAINVPVTAMRSLDEYPKTDLFELMFARKRGLPTNLCPIRHLAVAFFNPKNNTFAVYGRQSPYDISMWHRDGLVFSTRKDNEKRYITGNFGFTAYPTGVSLTQDEIKTALDLADTAINQAQWCNMVNSNCYSYSVTVMLFAIEALLKRPTVDIGAIYRILTVLEQHPLSDHASFGVLNNSVVVNQFLSVLDSIGKHVVIIEPQTEEMRSFTQKILTLRERISDASLADRILNTTYE